MNYNVNRLTEVERHAALAKLAPRSMQLYVVAVPYSQLRLKSAQRKAERMALQLKALKPYLNDIEDDTKRDELLAKIANRLFGQEEQLPLILSKGGKGKNDNPMLTSQLLEVVIELLKQSK